MKRLYILRHGQKEEAKPDEYDYDIQLTKEGKKQCEKIALILKDKEIQPDLIVSSPAIRTRQSSEIVAKQIGYRKNIMYNEVIYQAFLNEIIESITYTFDTVDTLMLVGHNPSLTALAFTFGGIKKELKPASLVRIDFDCNSWTAINKTNAKLIEHIEV